MDLTWFNAAETEPMGAKRTAVPAGEYQVVITESEERQTKAGKQKLYNFLARFILEKVHFPEDASRVGLVVDRSKNREEIRDFNQYVANQLQALLPLNTRLDIDHLGSHESSGLQAVDMFCWGVCSQARSARQVLVRFIPG